MPNWGAGTPRVKSRVKRLAKTLSPSVGTLENMRPHSPSGQGPGKYSLGQSPGYSGVSKTTYRNPEKQTKPKLLVRRVKKTRRSSIG
jgi:hypothetical protein